MTESFWMTAKINGHCAECRNDILAGDRIVYSPSERKAYCKGNGCGTEVAGEDPQDEKEEAEKILREHRLGRRKSKMEKEKSHKKSSRKAKARKH